MLVIQPPCKLSRLAGYRFPDVCKDIENREGLTEDEVMTGLSWVAGTSIPMWIR